MNYLVYIFFGLAPSIIWLLFYLREDAHPEPKGMIIQVFLLGAVIAIPVALIECIPTGFNKNGEVSCFVNSFFTEKFSPLTASFLYYVLIVGLTEEIFKYLVVRVRILKDSNFDEPLDAMIYMVIAALGFAALENILLLFQYINFSEIIAVSFARLIGAVFLHTLSSATIGYFLALSFYETKNHFRLLITGFAIAVVLHGLYNFSIMEAEGIFKILIPTSILAGLAIFVIAGFKKLKKLKSICK